MINEIRHVPFYSNRIVKIILQQQISAKVVYIQNRFRTEKSFTITLTNSDQMLVIGNHYPVEFEAIPSSRALLKCYVQLLSHLNPLYFKFKKAYIRNWGTSASYTHKTINTFLQPALVQYAKTI